MLEWNYNETTKISNGSHIVDIKAMERDFAIKTYYDKDLFKQGKTDKVICELSCGGGVIMDALIKNGQVVLVNMLDATFQTTNKYGENDLLSAIENFNMIVRYVMVETRNKDISQVEEVNN